MAILSEEDPPSKHESFGHFKTLVISNIAESYFRTYKKTDPKNAAWLTQYDILESERAIFYNGDHKAVVTSLPINAEFVADIKEILGYKGFLNLYPKSPTERISSDVLKDKNLFKAIVNIIKENPDINLIPYYATEEFFELVSILKQKGLKFTTQETVSAKNRFIRDHYNCKVGFRKLWERVTDENGFVKIPKGFIVDDLSEAIDAAWWFYQHKTDFVFKYNRGASGFGVVFYKRKDLPSDEKSFRRYLRDKHRNRIWFEENFVVEEMIDVDKHFHGGSPSVEFKINGGVRYQYTCVQRLGSEGSIKDSYFVGIMVAKDIEYQLKIDLNRVIQDCYRFGKALNTLGYRGIFDVDLVIDKKHNIYAVESNLRRTGGTHIFETAQYLFGKNFQSRVAVVSRDNLPVSRKIRSYSAFKKVAGSLYFSKEKKEGIIPNIPNFLPKGKVGYFAFAKDLDRILTIENKLRKLVG